MKITFGSILFAAGVIIGISAAFIQTFTKIDVSHLYQTASLLVIGGLFL